MERDQSTEKVEGSWGKAEVGVGNGKGSNRVAEIFEPAYQHLFL